MHGMHGMHGMHNANLKIEVCSMICRRKTCDFHWTRKRQQRIESEALEEPDNEIQEFLLNFLNLNLCQTSPFSIATPGFIGLGIAATFLC